ncbi:MAG TPA: prenyltransferase/squalene oxidase repeat-containing protein [Pirellulales bacterium]|jgi:squalene-hopene/tetraprenyl-beta-curcumene cyclase|nr:prenyltransferase/squalene oxidase repeat-containing protein [Pirellulales bacterium]
MHRQILGGLAAASLIFGGWAATATRAADNLPIDAKAYQKAVDKAIAYLEKTQNENGSFGKQPTPAITAICLDGILKTGRSVDDPMVAKALKFVIGFVQPDGGIYSKDSPVQNYETCLCLLGLHEANQAGRFTKTIKNAEAFLKKIQWTDDKTTDPADFKFGGAGYGREGRPDLSNTGFLMDALKATGNGPDDPAVKAALVFISRCQNLESEHNTAPFASKVNDGGFIYNPIGKGESKAANTPDMPEGALRSYGSMTYTGLKSMIFAGLTKSDKRVKAAVGWVEKNYDLDSNPGMGKAGLYYYYHTFAKALNALGQDEITDAKGVKHNWRQELLKELISRQQPDGSWVNDTDRWLEKDSSLVTGYVLMTMSYCKPK